MRLLRTAPAVVIAALLATGCSGASSKPKEDAPYKGAPAASTLMLDGQAVDAKGTRAITPRAAAATTSDPVTITPASTTWPAPTLLSNGTIDDGTDPFANEQVPLQALPIEDDPASSRSIDDWSSAIKKIDPLLWAKWTAGGKQSPWQQAKDPMLDSMVKVWVERCGGAHTVASGVVLGNETVVTTVHVVESAQRRVRVSLAGANDTRLPAIVRYLDVDDDIAVLKVPGLKAPIMPSHSAGATAYEWGFAYGVTQDGASGTLNRTPAIVGTQEQSLTVEQPDGFAEKITDRSVLTAVAGVSSGYSGGVVTATNDPKGVSGFGFGGLVRARVPFRANTAVIVVPPRLVEAALAAAGALDPWYEHVTNRCPQWHR